MGQDLTVPYQNSSLEVKYRNNRHNSIENNEILIFVEKEFIFNDLFHSLFSFIIPKVFFVFNPSLPATCIDKKLKEYGTNNNKWIQCTNLFNHLFHEEAIVDLLRHLCPPLLINLMRKYDYEVSKHECHSQKQSYCEYNNQ